MKNICVQERTEVRFNRNVSSEVFIANNEILHGESITYC